MVVGLRFGRAGGGPRGTGRRVGPTGGRPSEANNGPAELHSSSLGCGPIAHPVALVHSIRILAARSIVLSHPRTHWVSGDRPLRCIRVPRRETLPPPVGIFEGGCGFVNKHAFFLLVGLRVGRAGGGPRGSGGRAVAHGGRASEAKMDWPNYIYISSFGGGPNYIYRRSGAGQITYNVWGPRL